MAPPSSLVSKLKVQLKLSISRLRMVQQKDTAIAKQQRRAMAQLIEQGKLESARIRVENIIRSDITTELHEILELYCELLLARSQLLEPASSSSPLLSSTTTAQCDPGLEEAVRSLLYAAPRTDVKELHAARALLVDRFGKEFALGAMEGRGVAARVLAKLRVEAPSRELVDAYLAEIARTYGVRWPGGPATDGADGEEDGDDDDDGGDGEGGGGGGGRENRVKALEAPLQAQELSKATPPRDLGPKSPVRAAPPSPSSENVAPKVKGPGTLDLKPSARMARAGGGAGKGDAGGKDGPGGKIPDVDELAKRFAQLKR